MLTCFFRFPSISLGEKEENLSLGTGFIPSCSRILLHRGEKNKKQTIMQNNTLQIPPHALLDAE